MIGASLIIDKSGTRPGWTRVLDWILTALVWLIYFYLVRAALLDLYLLITESAAWVFAGSVRPSAPAIARFFNTLWDYCIIAVANGMILIAWARYNQHRFGGHERRIAGSSVSVADLAALYRLPAEDIARWQGSRILAMRHEADGTLISVTAREAGQTRPISPPPVSAVAHPENAPADLQ